MNMNVRIANMINTITHTTLKNALVNTDKRTPNIADRSRPGGHMDLHSHSTVSYRKVCADKGFFQDFWFNGIKEFTEIVKCGAYFFTIGSCNFNTKPTKASSFERTAAFPGSIALERVLFLPLTNNLPPSFASQTI